MDTASTAPFSAADVLANLYAAHSDILAGTAADPAELLELDIHYSKLNREDIIALANELALARQVRAANGSSNNLTAKNLNNDEKKCVLGAIRAVNVAGNEWDRELCRLFCHLCLSQVLMFTARASSSTSSAESTTTTFGRVRSLLGSSSKLSHGRLVGEGLHTLEMDNNTLAPDGVRCLAAYLVGEMEGSITQGEKIREDHLGVERGRLVGDGSKYIQHPTEQGLSAAFRSHLNTIEVLELAENHMMDLGCYCLSALMPHCKGLRKLSLVTNQLTGRSGITQFSKSLQQASLANAPSMLTQLRLDYNDLGDSGAACIAEAAALFLPNLRRLGLSDNSIGDEGAKAISKYIIGNAGCTVEYLNLSVNKIGTPGFIAIAEALSCRLVSNASRKAIMETYLSLQDNEDCPNTRTAVSRTVHDITMGLSLKPGVNVSSFDHQHLAGTPLVISASDRCSVVSSTSPSVNPNLLDIDIACNLPTNVGRFYLAAMASQFKYLLSLDVTSCNMNDEEMDLMAASIEMASSHPLTCGLLRMEWYNNPLVQPGTEQRLGMALDTLKDVCMSSKRGPFIQELTTRSSDLSSSGYASPQRAAHTSPSPPIHPITIATAIGAVLTAASVCFLVMRHNKNFR